MQIANYAPTGSNTQGVSYLIVDDKDVLKKASDLTVDYLENSPSIRPTLRKILGPLIEKYHETGEDSVLRGAPAIVVATSAKNFVQGRINSISCLTYLELFAPHIDLGSCGVGLFEHCATSENSPMLKLLDIPEDRLITGAVMVGYPKYQYQRLVERNPVDVEFYSD